jgi:hypothetical protein
MTSCIPQLSFSFYRHQAIRADFSGGQITSDAGLLPLRAFDQRHGLTRGLAECVCDDRDDSRVSHPGLSLLRQRLYQIIAGYEDATTLTGYVTIRRFKFLPINRSVNLSDHSPPQPLGELTLASRPPQAARCSARLVCEDLWRTGSQAGRDPARCRFH